MIDITPYLHIGAAFVAGMGLATLLASIGNTLARFNVTFRPDRDARFNGTEACCRSSYILLAQASSRWR